MSYLATNRILHDVKHVSVTVISLLRENTSPHKSASKPMTVPFEPSLDFSHSRTLVANFISFRKKVTLQ